VTCWKGQLLKSRPFLSALGKAPLLDKRDMVSRITEETLIMFSNLTFILAVGMIATVQKADARPWCYKTGPNTVQCIDR
jgi:hypothetical protein